MDIKFQPIGIIKTPFKDRKSTPRQPRSSEGAEGVVTIYPEFAEGLRDLEGFSHIYLLFYFHKSRDPALTVTPPHETKSHGVFATRSPDRPCGIGLSLVRLKKIEGNKLYIKDVDMLNGTPVLDIKPYTTEFDRRVKIKSGWMEGKKKKRR